MDTCKYKTKAQVLARGREAIGIPLRCIDKTGRLEIGKGAIGSILEESWFGYSINSDSEPDFPEAGVELKATPYIRLGFRIRAKERLVCNIINYMEEYPKTFFSSSFWHKCNTMLLMSYEHKIGIEKGDFTIDKATLFRFPDEDLAVIERDWYTIISKIRDGKAHEISEGDTLYLGACTKGATAATVRQQPFSDIPAKQRAYSLKQSYMTFILNNYIFGNKTDGNIIKDPNFLRDRGFERFIIDTMAPYIGRNNPSLIYELGIGTTSKNVNEYILARVLGFRGRMRASDEFKKAGIIPKTIRLQKNGRIKESMSFPAFRFTEIVQEEWEESTLRNYLEPTKFLFVVFEENNNGEYVLSRIKFWNIPVDDLEEVRRVWERTKQIIKEGVVLSFDGFITRNNLPKQSESRVAHVRPHARDSNDTYPLPDGRQMTKQCFWFNRAYIESIVNS